jgi:hypothetical protein
VLHTRIKHIKVHYHFIWEKILQGEINMKLTPTEEQVADIFKKGLNAKKFEEMRAWLGVLSRSVIQKNSVLRGSIEGSNTKQKEEKERLKSMYK